MFRIIRWTTYIYTYIVCKYNMLFCFTHFSKMIKTKRTQQCYREDILVTHVSRRSPLKSQSQIHLMCCLIANVFQVVLLFGHSLCAVFKIHFHCLVNHFLSLYITPISVISFQKQKLFYCRVFHAQSPIRK